MNKRIKCPVCNEEKSCYTQKLDEDNIHYFCGNCGYATISSLKINSDEHKEWKEKVPKLLKENAYEDTENTGLVWYLNKVDTVNFSLYPEPDHESYHWVIAPIKDIPEENKEMYPKDEGEGYYTRRVFFEEGTRYDSFTEAKRELKKKIDEFNKKPEEENN